MFPNTSRIAAMQREYSERLCGLFARLKAEHGETLPFCGPGREAAHRAVLAELMRFSNVAWHHRQVTLISNVPGELSVLAELGLPVTTQQCLGPLVNALLELQTRFARRPRYRAWDAFTARQVAIVVENYGGMAETSNRPPGSVMFVRLFRCLAMIFDSAPIWDWGCAGDIKLAALRDALALLLPTAERMKAHIDARREPPSRSVQIFLRDYNAVRTGAAVARIL